MISGSHAIFSRDKSDGKSIPMLCVGSKTVLLQPSNQQAQWSSFVVGRNVQNVAGESASAPTSKQMVVS
jgi:hypothetical protein